MTFLVLLEDTGIFIPGEFGGYYRKNILKVFEHLPDFARSKDPVFVFVHIEAPHPPFLFGPNGEEVYLSCSILPHSDVLSNMYCRYYAMQIDFINKKLKEAIDEMLRQSTRQLVIILQGDHGPFTPFHDIDPNDIDTRAREECPMLNAYYFSNGDYSQLTPDITPVNTFRVIFNKFFGTSYNFLETKNFILMKVKDKKETVLTDVTKKVHGFK